MKQTKIIKDYAKDVEVQLNVFLKEKKPDDIIDIKLSTSGKIVTVMVIYNE